MAKLRLKNIGPIKEGLEDPTEYLEFDGITVFIGNQGTGKSTIAKLFSMLSWLEKALYREDFTVEYVQKEFETKFLAYQNIQSYFRKKSFFEYEGKAFYFEFKKEKLQIKAKQNSEYIFPKIMYIPAERNFVSAVDRLNIIRYLPKPLYDFLSEYENAKRNNKTTLQLPVGNAKFEYNETEKISYLRGNNYRIDLLEASSGYQSLVPLVLVSKYLSDIVNNKIKNNNVELNQEQEIKIRKAITELLTWENAIEKVFKETLEKLSTRYKYARFINIIEEPEQNLFPDSQGKILFELFKYYNENKDNNFIFTTHSPYIISYLTLAIQADYLKKEIEKLSDNQKKGILLKKLNTKIPLNSAIDVTKVNIYQIREDGMIKKLEMPYGIPSDNNYLNEALRHTNELFDSLLEIEEEL